LAENRDISRKKKQKIDRSPPKLGVGNIDSVNGTIDFINTRFFGVWGRVSPESQAAWPSRLKTRQEMIELWKS
jgi:hypothetical protein